MQSGAPVGDGMNTDYRHFDWTLKEVIKERDRYKPLRYLVGHKAVEEAYECLSPKPLQRGCSTAMPVGQVVRNRLTSLSRAGIIKCREDRS